MNNQQFYLNSEKGHECIQLPKKENNSNLDETTEYYNLPKQNKSGYLQKDFCLSEFQTQEDKERAMTNLGIIPKLEQLRSLINDKVIEIGAYQLDEYPTQGHIEYILNSNSLYNLIQNYYTKEEIDNLLFLNYATRFLVENNYYKKEQIDEKLNALYNSVSKVLDGIDQIQQVHTTVDFNIVRFDGEKTNLIIDINGNGDILREVKIYINGRLNISKQELAYSWNIPLILTEDSTVRVIISSIYNKEKVFSREIINDYFVPDNYFYIGGGISYEEIFSNYSPIKFENKIKGSYNFEINNDDDKIIILIPKDTKFYRADMNGIEIEFTKFENDRYITLVSTNRYQRGTYNIDINS